MQKEYKTKDITIIWKPENATTQQLMEQIDACPAKALTYKLNK